MIECESFVGKPFSVRVTVIVPVLWRLPSLGEALIVKLALPEPVGEPLNESQVSEELIAQVVFDPIVKPGLVPPWTPTAQDVGFNSSKYGPNCTVNLGCICALAPFVPMIVIGGL